MARRNQQLFSSSDIDNNHKAVVAASAAVQTYVQVLKQQPDYDLSILKNLSDHLKTARKHGNVWSEKICPSFIKITADIIDYANTFQSFYDTLVKAAQNISDPTSRKTLLDGLKELEKNINQKLDNVDKVQEQILSFSNALDEDCLTFENDAKAAEALLSGDKVGIAADKKRIDAIHSAMKRDIGLMAGGGVAIAEGICMMVVGVILEIPTYGTSTVLIGGGLAVLAGGATIESVGAADYANQIRLLKKETEKKTKDELELIALKHADMQLKGFKEANATAVQSVSTLREGWLSLGSTLGEVIQQIENVDPTISGAIIVDQLNTANKDWAAALELAKTLEPNGKVSAKTVKDLEGTLKSLKKA